MKKQTYTLALLCSILLSFAFLQSSAQSWQWGKRAGSNFDEDDRGGGNNESTIDMATDYNGNVYSLALVYGKSDIKPPYKTDVDGHNIPNYGLQEILLTSFTCDGTYRWSKLIGTIAGGDVGVALRTDDFGGVYVTGRYHSYTYAGTDDGPLNIDIDSIIPRNNKGFFLVKYDTSGIYQWVRTPEPDTLKFVFARIPAVLGSTVVEMEVDAEGDVYLLCFMRPGAFANGAYVVTNPGMTYHMLVYSRFGVFRKGYKMDIECPTSNGYFNQGYNKIKLTMDKIRRKWYLTGFLNKGYIGEDSLSLGGTAIKNTCFLSRFNDAGKMEWLKENSIKPSGISSRSIIDKFGNIYISGVGTPLGVFNGYTFTNTLHSVRAAIFVMKLDSSGKTIWTNNSAAVNNNYGHSLAISGNTIGFNGIFVGKLTWDSYTFNWPTGGSYIPYFIRINSITGSLFGADTIACRISSVIYPASVLSVDRFSNFYAGGAFYSDNDMKVGSSTLVSYGGKADIYIAKHGRDNCDCIVAPTAGFSVVTPTGSLSSTFTFGGTSPSDSVVWYFGDSTESRASSPTHNFKTKGVYNVCVVVYNRCGSDVYCKDVPVGVTNSILETTIGNVKIYPNPTQDILHIQGAAIGSTVALYDMQGRMLKRELIKASDASINLQELAKGNYLLKITTKEGVEGSAKVLKE